MLVGQKIGPFLIDKELGSGAMGTVYRGVYGDSGVFVAVKVMALGLGTTNSNAAQRFEREAAILKQLRHPNIVRWFAHGKIPGTNTRWYAMEYVEGESLDKVMGRRERMTWEEIISLGQQLCSALQHAHEKGVIHRDLKPSNLMILPDGTLKLTDFGIAKDLDSTALTSANCTVGTASYMSPEQCRGEKDMTSKSDLYSLGVVFYELVTGRKPFNADNAMEMFMQHVSGKFERPSRLVPDLPVWFDNLICQLLEKKPEHRPLDATMVASTLNTIQEKVEAQQSAGVDVARSRRIDRKRDSRKLDESDREAARALVGGKRRPKKKPTKPAFYQRAWFIIPVALCMIAPIAAVLYVMLAPPSLDQLFDKSKALMEADGGPKWELALEDPLRKFRTYYRDAQGDKADQMRRWLADAEFQQCFEQVRKYVERTKANKPYFAQNRAEEIAFPAAVAEEAGDFEKAREGWKELQKEAGTSAWGVFAGRQLEEMDKAEGEEMRLQAKLDKIKEYHRNPEKDDPDFESLKALRFQRFGDSLSALQLFEELRDKYAGDPSARYRYLYAAKKVVENKKLFQTEFGDRLPAAVRLDHIETHLMEAKDLLERDASQAYVWVLDTIALYSDSLDSSIQKKLGEARSLQNELRRKLSLLGPPGD
jgi:serine/threonine-protein kinase